MKRYVILVFLTLSIFIISAQDRESSKLFPTRLTITSTDSTIGLSWKPSGEGESGYSIYRYTEQINSENLSKSEKISEVSADTTFFEDFPPAKDVPYFYAVLALDDSGNEHRIFIPFGNINLYGVSVLYIRSEEEILVSITGLKAKVDNGTALLTFSAEPAGREILLYRNTDPIRTSEDLLEAILIDRISSGTDDYIDTPISGVEYYYALVGSRAFKKGDISFVPGENSTGKPIILPTKDDSIYSVDADFTLRSRPLPYLSSGTVYQNRSSSTVVEQIPPVKLEQNLQSDINDLMSKIDIPDREAPAPVILDEDLDEDSPGRDLRLAAILSNEFISGEYETALNLLLRFQKLPSTREIEYRVHFYLGQLYYFMGEYQKSLVEFIFAEENFYLECKPWMEILFEISDLIES